MQSPKYNYEGNYKRLYENCRPFDNELDEFEYDDDELADEEQGYELIELRWLTLFSDNIPLLRKNIENIDLFILTQNPHAIQLIRENIFRQRNNNVIDVVRLMKHPKVFELIDAGLYKPRWFYATENPNPKVMEELMQRPEEINWHWMSCSKHLSAIPLLEANYNKIDWKGLSENPNAMHLLWTNTDKIDWQRLSSNPSAIPLLEANIDEIDWKRLSENPSAIPLLEKYPQNINWSCLSRNPSAIPLLLQNLDRINYSMLAMNENPDAMNLMFNHLNELTINDWYSRITQNPSAEPLLFNLNYDKMKQIFQPIAKEIIEYVFHPTRVQRFADTAGIDVADYLEYF